MESSWDEIITYIDACKSPLRRELRVLMGRNGTHLMISVFCIEIFILFPKRAEAQ